MTDKEQIIIDGVDVKDCRRRIGKNSYCRYFKRLCSDNNVNCVWKQLARKTQECKQLKEDYAELEQECERLKSHGATLLADKNATEIGRDDYMQRCKRLEQECEKLLEFNNSLVEEHKTIGNDLYKEIKEYRKKLQSKEQECEELKSQIDADYEDYSQELKTLRNIIENKEKRNARLFVISNNYRKALEEIEEYQKRNCEVCYRANTDKCNEGCQVFTILDIINKAKGERNAI